jgi:phosphate starvation-inducible protein PhoH
VLPLSFLKPMARKLKEQTHFKLRQIKPLTKTQEDVFHQFFQGQNLILHGVAGTGKTFISLYLALNEIFKATGQYEKIIILRSVVPSRDIGFLPGSLKEKTEVYEEPYKIICNELFQRGDGYSNLRQKNVIEFCVTSFLRGLTFNDCIIIVDEMQNMSYQELTTIITRVGDNCKIFFCGDYEQTDLHREKEKEGLLHFLNILKEMKEFTFAQFNYFDIVRSPLVKNFIIAESEYKKKKNV